MKEFLHAMVTNPDNTYSTKRVAGWICLFTAILIACYILFKLSNVSDTLFLNIFYGFLGAFLGSFGISSFDTYSYFKHTNNKNKLTEPTNKNTNSNNSNGINLLN